ncbi:sulfurtransferase-like selenium metabolism protein YedF [Desulfospira joergensenii]|uniref:sulfurtransferase-like selenium metabolism protein YedF n=1 Tax=Desulfospira joergensenii TaxID=53329 RepID=UPI0003F62993|nr:sulfurtransferase-like selenium metabolism protein YedF [Desulfospira joergensenii]
MTIKEIDCRSLECPAPVLKTKEAIENTPLTRIRILVDNEAAVENVSRFLSFQNFQVSVDSDGATSAVEGFRDPAQENGATESGPGSEPGAPKDRPALQKIMVMISSNRMGSGDDELGTKLMINYIKTLKEMGEELWRLVFVNSGVKLAVEGSPAMDDLNELGDSGVDILVCGTCLTHFGLMEVKKVGTTTNMLDIVTSMQLAEKAISL